MLWRQKLAPLRGPGLTLSDQGLVSLANFATVFLFARAMEPATFGLLALLLSSLLLVNAIQTAFVGHVHNVLGPQRDREGYRLLTGHLLVVQLSFAVLVTLLSVGALGLLPEQAGDYRLALKAFTLIILPWLVQDAARRMFYTDRRSGAALFNDALCYGTQAAGAAAMTAGFLPPTLATAGVIYAAACTVGAVAGLVQLARHGMAFSRERFLPDLRETWGISRFLAAGQVVHTGSRYTLDWIIIAYAGLPVLGAYRALVHLANIVNPIEQAVFLYLPPRASRYFAVKGPVAYRRWFLGVTLAATVVVAVIFLPLGMAASTIVELAYGSAYAAYPAALFLVLYLIAKGGRFAGSLLRNGLVATGASAIVLKDAVGSLVLTIAVGPLLVGYLGLVGVALTMILLALPLTVYAGFAFMRLGRASTEVILPEQSEAGAEAGFEVAATAETEAAAWDETEAAAEAEVAARTDNEADVEADSAEGAELVDGGNFADIFRTRGGRAIKRYRPHPQAREMARREYGALRALDAASAHRPSTIAVPRPHSSGADGHTVVMDWAPGTQLHRWVVRRTVTRPQADRIGLCLAQGCDHYAKALAEPLHDLTPLNVIWDETDDRLWLIDVGSEAPAYRPPPDLSRQALDIGNYLGWVAYQAARPTGRTTWRAIRGHLRIAVSQFSHTRKSGTHLSRKDALRASVWRYREITEPGLGRRAWFRSVGWIPAGLTLGLWLIWAGNGDAVRPETGPASP